MFRLVRLRVRFPDLMVHLAGTTHLVGTTRPVGITRLAGITRPVGTTHLADSQLGVGPLGLVPALARGPSRVPVVPIQA